MYAAERSGNQRSNQVLIRGFRAALHVQLVLAYHAICLLPAQMHWELEPGLHNQAVAFEGAAVQLLHEQPPAGELMRSSASSS
jgi:hypothetical protein